MITPTDKIIFDYYSKKGDHSYKPMESGEADDLIHYLYKGKVFGNTSELVQKIIDIPNVQFMGMACKGSIQRAVETAAMLSQFIPKDFDDDNMEDNARLTNGLTGDAVRERVDKLFKAQDAADELAGSNELGAYGVGSLSADVEYSVKDDLRSKIMRGVGNTKSILECYGVMKALIAKAKRTEVFPSQTVIKDVTLGNDIPKLLSDEIINLAIPELQHLTNLRFVTGQMLQYHLEEEKGVGRGSLTIYIDISGSMDEQSVGVDSGTVSKLIAVAGVCLALVSELDQQKRKYEVKAFNENVMKLGDSTEPEMLKLKLLNIMVSGGTNIQHVFDNIDTTPEDHDILVLSDAEFTNVATPDFTKRVGLIEFPSYVGSGFDKSKFDMALTIKHMDDFKPLTNFAI
jgi:hypothetical protein